MPLYSLREYIRDKALDLANELQDGRMSDENLTVFKRILKRHFRIKILLRIMEEPDPHRFWERFFYLCAYNVFKIGVEVVMKNVFGIEIPDEQ